jgi:hypothetical protein
MPHGCHSLVIGEWQPDGGVSGAERRLFGKLFYWLLLSQWQLYRGEALELKSTEDARGELELTPQQQLAIRHHGSM